MTINTEIVGFVQFKELPEDTRSDIARGLLRIAGGIRLPKTRVRRAVLPLVLVSPTEVLQYDRAVDENKVDRYTRVWRSHDSFPPIVIDSRSSDEALLEGGHRTISAIQAGMDKILAIDIAKLAEEIGI